MNLDNELIIVKTDNNKYLAVIDISKEFITNEGKFHFKDIETIPSIVTSSTGQKFKIYRPTFKEFILLMKRGPQIIYPKDISQIVIEANISSSSKVLEIGTGSGYQAAILAELEARTFSMEIRPNLAHDVKISLKLLGYDVHVRQGDGYYGWKEHAPFDRIIISAAANHVPLPLLDQLKAGGKLILPLGNVRYFQNMTLIEKDSDGEFHTSQHGQVRFVPMVGAAQE